MLKADFSVNVHVKVKVFVKANVHAKVNVFVKAKVYEMFKMKSMVFKLKLAIPCMLLFLLLLFPVPAMAAEIPPDGEYLVEMTLSGGSGRTKVETPAKLAVSEGNMTITVVWSSPYYTYMLVDDIKYDPVKGQAYSTFLIPVAELGADIEVQAETIAMSEPHLIDYTLHIDSKLIDVNYKNKPDLTTLILAVVVFVLVIVLIRTYRKHKLK